MPEWIHIIIRAIVFFAALFIATKILGKKQISELTFFEYISGITIGSIAGEVIMGLDSSIMHGMVGIGVFVLVTYLSDVLSIKNKKFRDIFEGKSTVLIQNGKILEDNLKKEKYTIDALSELLRGKDVFNIADVEFATLEPKGDLSVLLKKENQPITPKDLGIKVAPVRESQTVIMDGQILDDSLRVSGKTRNWLMTELEKLDVTLDNVFLAQIDSFGELHVDIFDDKLQVPSPQARPLLLASMKKCQADLELFSLETNTLEAKKMYHKNAQKLQMIINRLKPFLQ